jgi:hypothetical protein
MEAMKKALELATNLQGHNSKLMLIGKVEARQNSNHGLVFNTHFHVFKVYVYTAIWCLRKPQS